MEILIDGYGIVEIEGEATPDAVRKLKQALSRHFSGKHDDTKALIGAIKDSNRDLAKSIAESLKKLPAPQVKVSPPEVNVSPEVRVEAPESPPPQVNLEPIINVESAAAVSKIRVSNIARDYKGYIETCDLIVERDGRHYDS